MYHDKNIKFIWGVYFKMMNSLISKGKEAEIVYSIKYIPACKRSGWYPHPRIRARVGIREASNIT